jgi:hypothetical protein
MMQRTRTKIAEEGAGSVGTAQKADTKIAKNGFKLGWQVGFLAAGGGDCCS